MSSDINNNRFGAADYGVFVGMLAISAIIGIFYAFKDRKSTTTQDFLMGNRSMGVFPVALSLLASFLSAVTLLGLPAEIYTFGTQYWIQVIIYPLIMFITAYFFIPVFYTLGLTSSYELHLVIVHTRVRSPAIHSIEYLGLRFDRSVRTLGSGLFCFQMLLYMAVVLYAPSLALSQVTGISVWGSVLSIGIVCTFYTALGGMKAVIWTDVFQTVMMFGSILAVVIKGLVDVGGFSAVYEAGVKHERFEFFTIDPNPLVRHTFWTVCIGTTVNWSAVYSTNQAMVQRYLSVPTLRQAKLTVWVVLPFFILMITICCAAGLVIFTKYQSCDPVSTKQVAQIDQLFPHFVMETLGFLPGFPGLFVAGIFSGALSTVSSGVNSLAAVTLEDFIKTYISKDLPEKKATLYTKLLAIFYGLMAIALVAVAQHMGNVLQAALAIFGLIGAPIFAMFILGMFIPTINAKGALWGTISGIAFSLWIGIGAMVYKPYNPKKPFGTDGCSNHFTNTSIFIKNNFPIDRNEDILFVYRISYLYYGIIGAGVTIIVAYIISIMTRSCDKCPELDPKLLTPLVRRYYCRKRQPTQQPLTFENGMGWFTFNGRTSAVNGVFNEGFAAENIVPTFISYKTKDEKLI